MGKKTIVIGASTNRARYSYAACHTLHAHGHEFVPVGIKRGEVLGKEIQDLRKKPRIADVDTVTLYLNPQNQVEWYDYILDLKPNRIIFNPGTENPELVSKAKSHGIETEYACTLVLLSTGQY